MAENRYLTGKPRQAYHEQVEIGTDVDGGILNKRPRMSPIRPQAYHEQVEIGMDVDGGILNERPKSQTRKRK